MYTFIDLFTWSKSGQYHAWTCILSPLPSPSLKKNNGLYYLVFYILFQKCITTKNDYIYLNIEAMI